MKKLIISIASIIVILTSSITANAATVPRESTVMTAYRIMTPTSLKSPLAIFAVLVALPPLIA